MAKAVEQTAKPGRKKRLTREEQKRAIWQATMTLLKEGNYEKTTMLAIAKQARISKETLYAVFASKEDLFIALIEENAAKMQGQILLALEQSSLPFSDLLYSIAKSFIEVLTSESAVLINRVAVASAMPDNTFAILLEEYGRNRTMLGLHSFFAKALAKGSLHAANTEELAEGFLMVTLADLQIRRCLGLVQELSPQEVSQRAHTAVNYFLQLFGAEQMTQPV